ncbi:hypothetical protein HMPREF1340_02544, partial [Enterococcus faecalis ERV73]
MNEVALTFKTNKKSRISPTVTNIPSTNIIPQGGVAVMSLFDVSKYEVPNDEDVDLVLT